MKMLTMRVIITGWFCLAFISIASAINYYPRPREDMLRDRLCVKVATGRFDLIQFKSITFYSYTNSLVIFEGQSKIYVDMNEITPNGFSVDLNAYGWQEKELVAPLQKLYEETDLQGKQVDSVYYINLGSFAFLPWSNRKKGWMRKMIHPLEWKYDHKKYAAYIFTPKKIYAIDFSNELFLKVYPGVVNIYPEMGFLHDQIGNGTSMGYVIQRDYYDKTDDFIIYDLLTNYAMLRFYAYKKTETRLHKIQKATYYFVEKTSKPNEVLLVHRDSRKRVKSAPNKQLFQAVPVGFRHKDYLYLFDTVLGCVYVVHSPPASLKTQFQNQKNILLTRHNVPYEHFFQCPDTILDPFPHAANRCETTDSMISPLVPRPSDRIIGPWRWLDDNDLVWMSILFCIALFAIAAAGAGYWYYYYGREGAHKKLAKAKKPKHSRKRQSSSSARNKQEASNEASASGGSKTSSRKGDNNIDGPDDIAESTLMLNNASTSQDSSDTIKV